MVTRTNSHGGKWFILGLVIGGMMLLASVGAMAQSKPDNEVAVWTYPSGKGFLHPDDNSMVCVLAVGHPDREPEVHCAPIVVNRGTPV